MGPRADQELRDAHEAAAMIEHDRLEIAERCILSVLTDFEPPRSVEHQAERIAGALRLAGLL